MGAKNSKGKKGKKKGVSFVDLKKYLKVEVLDFLGDKRKSLQKLRSSNLLLILKQFYDIVCTKMDASLNLYVTYADEDFETNFFTASNNINSFKTFRLNYFEYPGNELFGITYIGKVVRKLKNKIKNFEFILHGYSIREEYFDDFTNNLGKLTELNSLKLDFSETVISSFCLDKLLTKLKAFHNLNVFHFSLNTKKIPFNSNIICGLKYIPKIKELKLVLREKDLATEFSNISVILNEKKTLSYLYIDITKNLVSDDCFVTFCKSLEVLKLLQELHLFIGFNKLRKTAFEKLNISLQHLDLLRILEINYGDSDIHEDNISHLANSIKSMKFLNNLSLRFCIEKEENIKPLLNHLIELKFLSVMRLNINNTFKNIPFSMKSITNAIKRLKSLEVLNLEFNEILTIEDDLSDFLSSLLNLKKLLYLKLNILCQIKDENYKKLLNPIHSMESLISHRITINNKII